MIYVTSVEATSSQIVIFAQTSFIRNVCGSICKIDETSVVWFILDVFPTKVGELQGHGRAKT